MKDWIEVFKTGTHTDAAGNTREWSEDDLDEIISASTGKDIPAVIGHPKTDDPAWGWVESIKKEAGSIWVKFKDLVPEFTEMIKKRMFTNRSVAINPEDLSLKHIGFLGAVPPAVKGLAGIRFSGSEAMTVIEFSSHVHHIQSVGNVLQRLREWMIGKFGMDAADKAIPTFEVDFIKSAKNNDKTEPVFSKQKEKKMTTFTEEELDRKLSAQKVEFSEAQQKDKARIIELEQEAAERKKTSVKQAVATFCEGLKKEGKLLPAWEKMGLLTFMTGLETSEGEIEFAEGKKETQAAFFKRFLEALPKVVEFAEIAKAAEALSVGGFNHQGKEPVDEASLEIHQRVVAYQAQNKEMSYIDALAAVTG